MNRITLGEIEKATKGRILSGEETQEILNVCTDSRKAGPGDLFVPIVGEVHDAHKFIPQVLEKDCTALLISEENTDTGNAAAILVDDTTKALQRLSAWYLEGLHLKTIAVTGSVGKTSTRDMVYCILKEKYVTGTALGNFNNDIGVPLTIFSFDDSMEAAVLEVGMDHFGEIHRLADIIRPDIGIITNVGVSHIENLGSREGILKAKMEITDFFGPENTLVINGDNDMLAGIESSGEYRLVRSGTGKDCDWQIFDIEDFGADGISYKLKTGSGIHEISLGIPGAHNALNSALAIAAANCLGVSVEEAKQGLSAIKLTGKRLTVKTAGGIKVIDDTYNAAPDSMKSAVDTLMHTEGKRKIAILGGMNELGDESSKYHEEIGAYVVLQGVEILITAGDKAFDIARGAEKQNEEAAADNGALRTEIRHFETKEALCEVIGELLKEGDTVLVKGSRTMEMELVADKILKEQE